VSSVNSNCTDDENIHDQFGLLEFLTGESFDQFDESYRSQVQKKAGATRN
jgi:hypothetical protein